MSSTVLAISDLNDLIREISTGNTLVLLGLPQCDACHLAKMAIDELWNPYLHRKLELVADLENQEHISFIVQNRITEFPAILIYSEGVRLCGWSGVYSETELVHETLNAKITELGLLDINAKASV
ncbi:MAG: hypothetical protein NVV72_10620 [Asticcacaulis sp.]|nr:hypothetical protein [Asticcacaulis sp.]